MVLVYFYYTTTPKDVGEQELEKISVKLHWFPVAEEHISVYVANDKGFYEEEGLEVEIIPGEGSTVAAKVVGLGQADVGFSSGDTALLSRANGIPLVVLAVLFQKPTSSIVSLKEDDFTKPEDLYGKKIGVNLYGASYRQFEAFLRINGIDENQLELVPTRGDPRLLLSDEMDAYLLVTMDAVRLEIEGHPVNEILLKDYGIEVYGSSIITSEDFLEEKPETVKKFMSATLKGLNYAYTHPDEAVEIFLKYNSDSDPEYERKAFEKTLSFLESDATKEFGLGYHTKEGWEKNQQILLDGEVMDNAIDLDAFYTTKFLS